MTYSLSDALRAREFNKFTAIQAGSQTAIAVAVVSGNIVIGSVSASVDSIYVQSGTINNIDSAYVASGNITTTADSVGSFAITTTPLPVSGNVVLCGTASGTGTVTPLICDADGYLIVQTAA